MNLTVSMLMAEWLDSIKNQVKPNTYQKYESINKNHIAKQIGSVLVRLVSNYTIQNFTNHLLDCELSIKTVNDILIVLNLAFRYTGLIKCGDCGSIFSCKTRYWKDKPPRYEYVCNSYHRYGVENCTSHRINESTLDCLVYDELRNILSYATKQFENIDAQMKKWLRQKGSTNQSISILKEQLSQRKSDQQNILLEKIRDPQRAEIYTQMLVACETDIDKLSKQISELENIGDTIKSRKAEIKSSIDVMQKIIDEGAISNTDLRMLINEIKIFEVDGKLDVKITFNGKFKDHTLKYDDGEILNLVSL